MKTIMSILAGGALLCLPAVQSSAAQTNWVANINFALTVYTQGDTITNGSIVTTKSLTFTASTRDIISRLQGTTNSVGGINHFSTAAKLILKISAHSSGGPVFFVRDVVNRTNIVDTDVSAYITASGSDSIKSSVENLLTHKQVSSRKAILQFSFDDKKGLSFELAGLSSMVEATIVDRVAGNIGEMVQSVSASLAGTGMNNEDQLSEPFFIIKGNVIVNGGKVEIK